MNNMVSVSKLPIGTPLNNSNKVERVRVLFADQLNLARGKYIPSSEVSKGKARFSVGTYAVTYDREMVAAPGGGVENGLPDMELKFDPNSLRQGWEDNTQIALGDLYLNDEPFSLCGRSALKRAIMGWRKHGLEPMIGYETEAYIFERDDNGDWVPYNTPGACVYGTGPMADPAGLTDMIWEMAYECGFHIESLNAEYDTPQFELTLRFDDALQATDDIFLFRQMARELLFKRGYLLCFMPKPIAKKGGSGFHINLSMADKDGNNIFSDIANTRPMEKTAAGCVAGMLHHHESLGAILAPTVNSYARLQPANLCGYWANWGYDHRAVTVRVSAESGSAARVEHRLGDCAASPYFAAAALLQASLLGFENEYELPDEETNDGIEAICTDRHISSSLSETLDALEDDTVLTNAIGQDIISNFIAIKRTEIEHVGNTELQEQFDYYSPFI